MASRPPPPVKPASGPTVIMAETVHFGVPGGRGKAEPNQIPLGPNGIARDTPTGFTYCNLRHRSVRLGTSREGSPVLFKWRNLSALELFTDGGTVTQLKFRVRGSTTSVRRFAS